MSWLWFFLPDEALPLVIVGVGLLWILGVISAQGALRILSRMFLLVLIGPFVEMLVGELPSWVLVLVLVWVVLAALRGLATLLLGRGAADEMVGTLAAHFVMAVVLLPFRLLRWLFGMGRHRG
ncbi:MAG: hypothetical protein QXT77_00070 [Candidatus Methanomethylicaceae archaeon]